MNAMPFCRVSSWLSGHRLVSLPFSDHCTPLVESSDEMIHLLTHLQEKLSSEKWSYIEIRLAEPMSNGFTAFAKSQVFCLHKLDLRPGLDDIFRKFHKDCVQRKIHRACREQLTCEEGRSDSLVDRFYDLLVMTRRRHGVPAQPVAWFRNLMVCMGEKAKIRLASKDGRPIASILTLRHKRVLVYKYGCSDRKFSNLGATHLLFWKAIEEAKREQLSEFDLGRSDGDNPGLLAFKDRWGATRRELTYLRYPLTRSRRTSEARQVLLSKYVWSHAPSGVLAAAGRALYKHMG